MSWLIKFFFFKIKCEMGVQCCGVLFEGLWSKCLFCEVVFYVIDLENNLQVCFKCGYYNCLNLCQWFDLLLDLEGCFEIGVEVILVDILKFKDLKCYLDCLMVVNEVIGEIDLLVVL